jgi:hypothetical protein
MSLDADLVSRRRKQDVAALGACTTVLYLLSWTHVYAASAAAALPAVSQVDSATTVGMLSAGAAAQLVAILAPTFYSHRRTHILVFYKAFCLAASAALAPCNSSMLLNSAATPAANICHLMATSGVSRREEYK